MKKKLIMFCVVSCIILLCMASTLETTVSSYAVLYQNVNVAGAPDTTLLDNPTAVHAINAISDSTNFVDLWHGSKKSSANAIQFIFSHGNGTGDADATTSVFELWGQNTGGPRQLICTIALTAGDADVVPGTDDNTWVDTAVVTSYHTTAITVADSAANRTACVTLDVTGFRYLQGLFTGSGSTSIITTAYYRYY